MSIYYHQFKPEGDYVGIIPRSPSENIMSLPAGTILVYGLGSAHARNMWRRSHSANPELSYPKIKFEAMAPEVAGKIKSMLLILGVN